MIKLFSLKQQKKDGEQTSKGTQKKSSAAQLRIQKGIYYGKLAIATMPSHSVYIYYYFIII